MFAVERSTSVGRDRDVLLTACYGNSKRLRMYTANDGKKTSSRLGKERSSSLLHRPKTIGFLFGFTTLDFLYSGQCSLRVWEGFTLYFSRLDAQWKDLSNGVSVVVIELVVVEMLPLSLKANFLLWNSPVKGKIKKRKKFIVSVQLE